MFSSSQSRTLAILIQMCILSLAVTQEPVSHTLVTRLTHYLATDSPFFDPTKSSFDLAQRDLKISLLRASYLTANSSSSSSSLIHLMTDIETELDGVGGGFLAHLHVGSRSLEQLVYMDTGSSLLWINCQPCVLTARDPIFDPKSSSSFAVENCGSTGLCSGTGGVIVDCSKRRRCEYRIRYGTSDSTGYLARDTFKFGKSGETLQNTFFGCSRTSTLKSSNGILGLGANHVSILAQRGSSRFSYCLGNVSDTSYPYNTLAIGDQVAVVGDRIPLIVEDKYYINLEGISIGDQALAVDPGILRRNSRDYTGGMVVDVGSTYTFIPGVVLDKFEVQVIGLIDFFVPRNYSIAYRGHRMLCYDGVASEVLEGFPTVRFLFQGGATMELAAANVFHPHGDASFCLAILPSEILGTTVSILGSVMQQYFYIAYDLKAMQLAFQSIECDEIGDYVSGEL